MVRKTRRGIEAHLSGLDEFDPDSKDASELWKNQGVFVTLKETGTGTLRGCIGNPYPQNPLLVEAVQSGILAATSDPRFDPVSLSELRTTLCLELTVLCGLEEIKERNPSRIADSIRIGRDGLMVEGYGRKGLLLPQVAIEEKFDAEAFLTNCCLKAGLPPDAWLSPKLTIYKFGGQVFAEDSPDKDASETQISKHQ